MNKGFTLVELLAVLTILSVITLVAVPNVITMNKKTRQNDIEQFKRTVENAAEVYVETHLDLEWVQKLKNNGEPYCIDIKDLIVDPNKSNGSSLLNPNLKNPANDTPILSSNGSVSIRKVNYEDEKYEIVYKYQDGSCT